MNRRLNGLVLMLALTGWVAEHVESAEEDSAFIQSFANSSVEWMSWGQPAFDRARDEDKPVFLFMGAFASELSRAMRDQSFELNETVTLLNENFICILVDRDERPALAAFNQAWLRAAVQMRGWPLNLWLTPELTPFDGANYLPPSDEWGNVGFLSKLKQVLAAWETDPSGVRLEADRIMERLVSSDAVEPSEPIDGSIVVEILGDFGADWMAAYDSENGGFGPPPRHPRPELLRSFLFSEDPGERDAALSTLRLMAAGGLHDPLDGGFFRYTSDEAGLLPYFQKTLSDQARLALAYLDAAGMTGEVFYGKVAGRLLRYALSQNQGFGGFCAAVDGTPESIQPSFFWSLEQVRSGVGEANADLFCETFAVRREGNLPPDAYLSVDTSGLNLPRGFDEANTLDESSEALLALRRKRTLPLVDSAADSGTHGLLLTALARAGNELGRLEFSEAAETLAEFIRETMISASGLLRAGVGSEIEGSARDYVLVSDGLLTFAETTGDESARGVGLVLAGMACRRFGDLENGRFLTSADTQEPGLWARVAMPTPDTSGLPGVETAFVLSSIQHGLTEQLNVPLEPFVTTIVDTMEMSAEQPTGDQLLALRALVMPAE